MVPENETGWPAGPWVVKMKEMGIAAPPLIEIVPRSVIVRLFDPFGVNVGLAFKVVTEVLVAPPVAVVVMKVNAGELLVKLFEVVQPPHTKVENIPLLGPSEPGFTKV